MISHQVNSMGQKWPVTSEKFSLDETIFTSFPLASDSWIIALKTRVGSCRLQSMAFSVCDSELQFTIFWITNSVGI